MARVIRQQADPGLPRCRCGHDRTHPFVHPKPRYGFWGLFHVIFFPSARPKEISFQCSRCGEEIETSRDPAVLNRYR